MELVRNSDELGSIRSDYDVDSSPHISEYPVFVEPYLDGAGREMDDDSGEWEDFEYWKLKVYTLKKLESMVEELKNEKV